MNRIDVHCHFLPALDDGCRTLRESLDCFRQMVEAGYTRIFCTPHCGTADFSNLPVAEVAQRVQTLQAQVTEAGMALELRPGGELRLSANLVAMLPAGEGGKATWSVPTYGNAGKYVLTDIWEEDWPEWATEAVEWLQAQSLTVIIAHPERMGSLLANPGRIDELAKLGVLFQGNLAPIGGSDSVQVVSLAERYLLEGRYFMVGTDGHRSYTLPQRLAGLDRIRELVGAEKLEELTVKNPSRLWQ